MKCQKCGKQAVFHITEMIDATPLELHLCQDHAYEYLHQNGAEPLAEFGPTPCLQEATDELVADDFQVCPYCRAGFQDFRMTTLVGCANDYRCFFFFFEPVIQGLQGATQHGGKRPLRSKGGSNVGPKLVRLRTKLADAIEVEDYELASRLRDQITELENRERLPNSNPASDSACAEDGSVK